MVEPFNILLYALTILFGVEAPISSGYTEVNIDAEKHIIEIYYSELQCLAEYEENMDLLVGYLDSLNSLDEAYSGLSILSNEYSLVKGKYNYHLKLKFDDNTVLRDNFKIDLDAMMIYIHAHENVTINSQKALNTKSFSGELFPVNKAVDNLYSIKYVWDYSDIPLDLIPLTP